MDSSDQITERRGPVSIAIFSTFGIILAITALVGNFAVIQVSIMDEALSSNVSNLLVVNLAVADLIGAVIMLCPAVICLICDYWIFGDVACSFQGAIYYICVVNSMMTLAMVSIDRGISILKPLRYPDIVTRFRMTIAIVISWLYCIAFFGVSVVKDWNIYTYDEGTCGTEFTHSNAYLGIGLTVNAIIPSVLIIIFNGLILYSTSKLKRVAPAKKSESKLKRHSKEHGKQSGDTNSKLIASILIVVGVFFGCMLPFVFERAVKVFNRKLYDDLPKPFVLFSSFFQFISLSINPYIYAILRKDYRNGFKKIPRYLNEMLSRG